MLLDYKTMDPLTVYRTMIQTIVPRPVAWILSENEAGNYNLAPFSYFNAVSSQPPLVFVSIGSKREGLHKDTRANILRTKDCVIHIPSSGDAKAVTASSLPFGYGESEVELGSHEIVHEAELGRLPRLKAAKVAFHCSLERQIEVGPRKQGILFLELHTAFVQDELITRQDDRYVIDAMGLDPLARLGGDDYGTLGSVLTVERPPYEP